MKLLFLGTGASKGIPVIGSNNEVCLSTDKRDKRLRSSVLISWNNCNYIIDCGPDFRQQMLRENITKIEAILYTHEHSDHTAGLDDIRPFTQRYGDLPIYVSKRVLGDLKRRFSYIFVAENKYKSAPGIIINTIKNNSFQLNGMLVVPIEIIHGSLPIFGFRFNKIAYLTDVGFISEIEKNKLLDLEILVVNALQIKEHPMHYNLQKALNLIKEVKPKRAYITHISHKLGFHKLVEMQLPKNVFLAYDGLQVEVN